MLISRFSDFDTAMLSQLTTAELDALPFGAIGLDGKGTITAFNATEGRLAGMRPETVIGRNFFTDVAPCTNTPEFYGRFAEGVAKGALSVTFEYLFTKKRRLSVWIHMMKTSEDQYWLLIKGTGE